MVDILKLVREHQKAKSEKDRIEAAKIEETRRLKEEAFSPVLEAWELVRYLPYPSEGETLCVEALCNVISSTRLELFGRPKLTLEALSCNNGTAAVLYACEGGEGPKHVTLEQAVSLLAGWVARHAAPLDADE